MKINFKVRLKNKTFVAAMATLLVTFIYQLLALLGVVPKVSQDTVTSIIGLAVNALAAFGVLVDPTTASVSDSARALTYGTDDDVRDFEVKQ